MPPDPASILALGWTLIVLGFAALLNAVQVLGIAATVAMLRSREMLEEYLESIGGREALEERVEKLTRSLKRISLNLVLVYLSVMIMHSPLKLAAETAIVSAVALSVLSITLFRKLLEKA